MSLDKDWLTEFCDECGTAFSLKLGQKLDEVQTPFQKIEIFSTKTYGNVMLIDGCYMLSTRENFFYHEMMSHPALFTHPDPKNIVIIGGGDCGTLKEVLKHPGVKRAVQVDIDEQVTRLSEKYFPELCSSNNDPRAQLLFDDGIKYMAEAEPGSIDVVIVDSTDPIGPAEGLFNKVFYQSCFSALGEQGILVQQSESPLLHMRLLKEMRQAMLDVGFSGVQALPFPQSVYPSGWWSATMAGKQVDLQNFRSEQAKTESLDTEYYNEAIHRGALAMPQFMRRAFNIGNL